jgi:MinD superfamily P-loop ATPase
MKKVTVLSGKGGVGKSTITASLAITLAKEKSIVAVDCDVDASNLAIVLGVKDSKKEKLFAEEKAVFDLEKCNSCGKCVEACYFNAIKLDDKPRLDKFACEGCGVCELVCPEKAVKMVRVNNAIMSEADTEFGFPVISSQLKMGYSGSGKIVAETRERAEKNKADIMLIDSAAGVGCPVIASVVGTDYVIAVTEPTPSGFSDLKRALTMVEHFKIPYGIIINKFDLNIEKTKEIEDFAKKKGKEILTKLPYDKKFVESLVNLIPIIEYDKKYLPIFEDIKNKLIKEID